MLTYTTNYSTGRVRRENRNGKPVLIAPATLIVSGVLEGSQGKIFYSPSEVCSTANAWAGVPLTLDHPAINGQAVSADHPAVRDTWLGLVENPECNQGKLTADAVFDVTTCNRHGLLAALERGQPIELSTGLYLERQPFRGNFRGREFTHLATNFRPNHVAILLHQRGACSVSDGCGVFSHNSEDTTMSTNPFGWDARTLNSGMPTIDKHDTLDVPVIDWAAQAAVNNAGKTNVTNALPVSVGPNDPLPDPYAN